MAILRKGTFTLTFLDENNREETYATLPEAHAAAQRHVGNRSYARPFAHEPTFLYGPGDGTTTLMIREDVEFTDG